MSEANLGDGGDPNTGDATRIAANLGAVHAELDGACRRAGREPASVRLIAVSKRHSAGAIEAAYRAGQHDFGENYVQELSDKAGVLAQLPDVRFRFIGHLQRNKVNRVVELGCAIDTIDSERLAAAVDRSAAVRGRHVEVLLQVNVDAEPQKAGVAPESLPALVEAVRGYPHLRLRGLMTVPRATEHPEQSRAAFRALRMLAQAHGLPELSMGMSADMTIAIEEGATMIRVGTRIFGPRERTPLA